MEYRVVPECWEWERVASEMREREQVLCVVNSRKDALSLFKLLNDADALHLSTMMCQAHRKRALAEIRSLLKQGRPCRVVSTQLVEAGVDLDFPCVMRATGPLDRIVQAGGRCNREGLLSRPGEVIIFKPCQEHAPKGAYATAIANANRILDEPECDLHGPSIFEKYSECSGRTATSMPIRSKALGVGSTTRRLLKSSE